MSWIENTRPRKLSSTCCCRIVAVQMATPCAASPSANPMIRKGTCWNVAPSRPVTTPPLASMIAGQPVTDSGRDHQQGEVAERRVAVAAPVEVVAVEQDRHQQQDPVEEAVAA